MNDLADLLEEVEKKEQQQKKLIFKIKPELIKCKIVDLGNACWFDKHFSVEIQTREYRSPEVILGHEYDLSADIWSMGCTIFELLTGQLLFPTTPNLTNNFSQDHEHLAMMIRLLGKIPTVMVLTGRNSQNFIDQEGNLLHNLSDIKTCTLKKLLYEKYNFSKKDAKEISDFLLPMLEYDTKKRASAKDCLNHPWLK